MEQGLLLEELPPTGGFPRFGLSDVGVRRHATPGVDILVLFSLVALVAFPRKLIWRLYRVNKKFFTENFAEFCMGKHGDY